MPPTDKLFRFDLAQSYGVDVRTIDRWRQDRVLPRPRRTPAGRAYWTPEQIQRVEQCRIKRWSAAEKKRVAIAAKLLKKKSLATVKPRQFGLPLQINLPLALK